MLMLESGKGPVAGRKIPFSRIGFVLSLAIFVAAD